MQTAYKILQLLDLLSGIRSYSKEEIMDRIDINNVRTFYRYLEVLRNFGFVIDNSNGRYIIEKNNKSIKDISSLLHFSEEEAYILNEAINTIDTSTKARENLVNKLSALYDTDRIAIRFISKENSSKIKPIIDSIKQKKKIKIHEYRSSGSGSITDRIVEAFEFTPNYVSVWAYEKESDKNKVFKIDRIKKVELLDENWEDEARHEADKLDCFRMSGKEEIPVKFEMTLRAKNLLTEEFPLSEQFIKEISENKYLFDGRVTRFEGIGRFILGLPGEISHVDNPELLKYMQKKLKNFKIFILVTNSGSMWV